jgi:hypothetical protein
MMTELKTAVVESEAQPDRVRAHSNASENRRIDAQSQHCLERCAEDKREEISRHIEALDHDWDVERYLQMNAGLVSLSGVLLGALVNRRFLLLPAAVFGFFFQHATQGWCPPLPVFRRMGVRTRREINREKFALKALRGDLENLSPERQSEQEQR